MALFPYVDMETLDPIRDDPSPYNPDCISGHNIHRAMAHHPEALRVFWPRIGTWIRGKSILDPRLRELAIIQASYVTACGYVSFLSLLATAIPSAAEMEVEECPTPKVSYSLSDLFGKPLRPLNFRLV